MKKYIAIVATFILIIFFIIFNINNKRYTYLGENENWNVKVNIKQHKNNDNTYSEWEKMIATPKVESLKTKKLEYMYFFKQNKGDFSSGIRSEQFKENITSESFWVDDKPINVKDSIQFTVIVDGDKTNQEEIILKLK